MPLSHSVTWLLVWKWGVSKGGDDGMASWGTHLFGVFPIPQHPCHVCGMGAATSRLQSWVCCGSWFANEGLVRRWRWGYGHTHGWVCVQFPSAHVCGMGADPRSLTWVCGSLLVSFRLVLRCCGWAVSTSTRSWGSLPFPSAHATICMVAWALTLVRWSGSTHTWYRCCRLSFAVLGALWFLVCKRGVSEGGVNGHGVVGHSPCWGVSHSPGMGTGCRSWWCCVTWVSRFNGEQVVGELTICQCPRHIWWHGCCPSFAVLGTLFIGSIVWVVTWQWAERTVVDESGRPTADIVEHWQQGQSMVMVVVEVGKGWSCKMWPYGDKTAKWLMPLCNLTPLTEQNA